MIVLPTPLAWTHLAVLGGAAAYLASRYPAGAAAVCLVASVGAAVLLLLPTAWRAKSVGELAIAAASGAAGYVWGGDNQALHAVIGIGLATLFLAPARAGWLPITILLAMSELAWLAGRSGLGGGLDAARVLVPAAVAVLAISAWLAGLRGVRKRRLGLGAWLLWAAIPASLAAMAGLWLGPPLERLRPEPAGSNEAQRFIPGDGVGPGGRPTGSDGIIGMHLGDNPDITRDERARVRVGWSGPPPAISATGTIYLRALALANMEVRGTVIEWLPERTMLPVDDPPVRPPLATLYRLSLASDVVLRLDGAPGTDLPGLMGDALGNRWAPGISRTQPSYTIALRGIGEAPARSTALAAYRLVPDKIAGWPWAEIEDPRWRELPLDIAATAVCNALANRCEYAIQGLPPPMPEAAGALRGFLFGPRRIGHCQYFATAAAVLMRRAGFAARCVVGYASDEIEGTTATFRGRHAHAWIEVAGQDGQWLRVDPTPGNAPVPDPEERRANQVADASSGPSTAASASTGPGGDPGSSDPGSVGAPAHHGHRRTLPAMIITALAALAALAWWWWRHQRDHPSARQAHLERRAADLARLAAELGITVHPGTTLHQLADALSRTTGLDLTWWRDAHQRARFGNGPLPPPWPVAELRRAARARTVRRAR
jgi:transglutaminase-like putative cysteine protease